MNRMVKTVDQLYENISLFSASKMALAKLRTPTVLEENARKNLGILLSNSIADLSSETPTLMTSKSGKKALPIVKEAFDQGRKVRFTKGKLFIDGKAVPVE